MSQDGISERVEGIVADVLRVDAADLDDGTVLGEDVPAESLDYFEIAETVEAELGVAIPDEDLEAIETVGDLESYVVDARDRD
jgi:acyl carrier protein